MPHGSSQLFIILSDSFKKENIFFFSAVLAFSSLGNRSGQYIWEDHRPRSGVWKGTSGGEVISFSGCDDDQTSADTSVS